MAKQKPSVTIHLDKQREIYFTMQALEEIEEALQIDNVFELLNEGVLSAKMTNALAWAGMIHKEPNLSRKEAARRLSEGIQRDGFDNVAMQLQRALLLGLGIDPDKAEEEAKQKAEEEEAKN